MKGTQRIIVFLDSLSWVSLLGVNLLNKLCRKYLEFAAADTKHKHEMIVLSEIENTPRGTCGDLHILFTKIEKIKNFILTIDSDRWREERGVLSILESGVSVISSVSTALASSHITHEPPQLRQD